MKFNLAAITSLLGAATALVTEVEPEAVKLYDDVVNLIHGHVTTATIDTTAHDAASIGQVASQAFTLAAAVSKGGQATSLTKLATTTTTFATWLDQMQASQQ